MPSPFPGMNPYLEQTDAWHDFHHAYISSIRNALVPQIRPAYLAKVDENVYIHELSADERYLLGRPDVAVIRSGPQHSSSESTVVSAAEPTAYGRLLLSTDRISEPYVEIQDRESRELITVIELLSPTNKNNGPDREQYIAKRRQIVASNVHFVEIDLLRGAARMPVEGLAQSDYAILVSRSYQRPQVELWPLKLREPLPRIPIPLRQGDGDAVIDLQQLLHEQFDAAGYEDYIYTGQPHPPLHRDDMAWAQQYLRQP